MKAKDELSEFPKSVFWAVDTFLVAGVDICLYLSAAPQQIDQLQNRSRSGNLSIFKDHKGARAC